MYQTKWVQNMEILKNICLGEALLYGKGDYETIAKNMINEEFYFMQDKIYDLFIKIKIKEKMVGFIVCNYHADKVLILELGYILPEYRNKGLFIETISVLETDYTLWLDLPNRFLINSLLANGKARVITGDYLVKSDYLLSFRNPANFDERLSSYYYDLRISGVVSGEYVSPLMSVDVVCFNADVEREKYMYSDINSDGDEVWYWS